MAKMKVFTCTDFDSSWPNGCASVIVAEDEDSARAKLNIVLVNNGLRARIFKGYTLHELDLSLPKAIILCHTENYA